LTKWRELVAEQCPTRLGLEETLLGGQSFSWTVSGASSWRGVIGNSLVELRFRKEKIEWSTSDENPISEKDLRHYLWLEPSYDHAVDSLPWRSDPVLDRCRVALPGLRILRQPMDEVLFTFLLSSVKSIPQIKEMRNLVAERYGRALGSNLWSFPGWERLARVPEAELRQLKMGYRAKYVAGVARTLSANPSLLNEIVELPYVEARGKLLELPGVGPKVADCCLLFGAFRVEAFPVDTWISKTLGVRYGLKGWSDGRKESFARIHFGPHAGLAQQFLFSGERLGLHDRG